jgi:hypothetical protein
VYQTTFNVMALSRVGYCNKKPIIADYEGRQLYDKLFTSSNEAVTLALMLLVFTTNIKPLTSGSLAQCKQRMTESK